MSGNNFSPGRQLWVLLAAAALLVAGCATTTQGGSQGEGEDGGDRPAGVPDNYPQRPIELTVVYPAGGGMDVTARALGAAAEEVTDFEYRVINRAGAGGLVGHTYLAQQAGPEGYELGVIAVDFLVFDTLLRGGEFSQSDFAPLAYIAFEPIVQVVRADSPLGELSYQQILQRAQQNPGDIRIGVVPDTTFDVFTGVVEAQTDAEFTEVPFDGGLPGVTALLGGQIDMTNAFYAEVESHLESGELVPVAISDTEPYDALPDVPTMSDVGVDVPAQTFGAGRMVVGPSEMPAGMQEYLSRVFTEVLESDVAAEQFETAGAPLAPQDRQGAQDIYQTAFAELGEAIEELNGGGSGGQP